MSIVCGIWIPSGTGMTCWSGASGNVSVLGDAYSPSLTPSAVSGTLTVGKAVESVLSASAPLAPPGAAGVNFVWTVSLSPLARVTGNVTGTGVLLPILISLTWPAANWLVVVVALEVPVLAVTPVKVTGFVAVTDTDWVLVAPTAVGGRVAVVAAAGAAVPGAAYASTWPSRVPT